MQRHISNLIKHQDCEVIEKSATNLNHEHIRGGWIDSRGIVLLAREVLVDEGAQAVKVLGPLQGAQCVEVGQDGQSLNLI